MEAHRWSRQPRNAQHHPSHASAATQSSLLQAAASSCFTAHLQIFEWSRLRGHDALQSLRRAHRRETFQMLCSEPVGHHSDRFHWLFYTFRARKGPPQEGTLCPITILQKRRISPDLSNSQDPLHSALHIVSAISPHLLRHVTKTTTVQKVEAATFPPHLSTGVKSALAGTTFKNEFELFSYFRPMYSTRVSTLYFDVSTTYRPAIWPLCMRS